MVAHEPKSDSECGTTMIEYALLAALVSLIAVLAVPAMSQEVGRTFNTTGKNISKAVDNSSDGGNTCHSGTGDC